MNKKMLTKIITAVCIIAVVIPPLLFGGVLIQMLIGFIAVVGGYEIAKIETEKSKYLSAALNIVAILCMYYMDVKFFPVVCAFYVTALFVCVLCDEKTTSDYAVYNFTMSVLLGMAAQCVTKLYGIPNGFWIMMYICIACYMTDTGAYFFGSFMGKHKMIPRVSPNKTWEGSVGGYATGALSSLVFGLLLVKQLPVALIVCGSLTLPVLAQIGDLAYSSVKRRFRIKDFGNIFPGHGGVLDRVDSLLFCLMFFNGLMILWGF